MKSDKFNLEYYGLSLYAQGPAFKPGPSAYGSGMACFSFTRNIVDLFPYINAVAERPELYSNPTHIKFKYDDSYCVLYPRYGLATPFNEKSEALSFMENLISFLVKIGSDLMSIEPNYKLFRKVSVLEILKLLPVTNCRKCGFSTCLAFAGMLSIKQVNPEVCPFLGHPIAEQAVFPVYNDKGELHSTVSIDIDFKKSFPDRLKSHKIAEFYKEKREHPPSLEVEAESFSIPLTEREQEVLRMVAKGATNKNIALSLKISPHTVKSHVIHIFDKLGVNDRTQAAVLATQQNLI